MTVETYTPEKQSTTNIRVSEPAVKHLTEKLAEKSQAKGVRISVKPSGCSGYMYVLDYVDAPESDDTLIEVNAALTLYVDTGSLSLLNGTEIDFVKQGLNAAIQFKNPNVTGECGCGESFTVN